MFIKMLRVIFILLRININRERGKKLVLKVLSLTSDIVICISQLLLSTILPVYSIHFQHTQYKKTFFLFVKCTLINAKKAIN
jgi:hypothetical protein